MKQGFPKHWTWSLTVHIFKTGDKHTPSNYMIIIISDILAKLYELNLEKNINLWLESHGKRAKGQARFRIHHLTMYHFVTLRIIIEK